MRLGFDVSHLGPGEDVRMAASPSSLAHSLEPAAVVFRPRAWRPMAERPSMTPDKPPFEVPYDDPAWFLDDLDLTTGLAQFVRADREVLSRLPFLDPRWRREALERRNLPGAVLDLRPAAPAQLNF